LLGEGWFRLGEAYRCGGNQKAAVPAYRKCMEYDTRFAYRARHQLAMNALVGGDLDEAEAALVYNLKMLRWESDPEALSQSLFALGSLLYQRRDYRRVVRYLEDENGDGVYDRQTTFLDSLPFPTSVMAWRNGVLVASAPDIFYAEDRDDDGKADHREVLFTGFTEGNQQHRINGFELGLDGWIYGANGDSGGSVRSLRTGKSVNIRGRDFRFKPDTGEFETDSGQTQFGRHRNDWGDWFGNSNPTWGWHFVLAEADLKRNPDFAPPDPRHTLEGDTRLYPTSRTLARFNDPGAANHVTSANSPTPYRDELFGPRFAHSLFASEPVHNLVHRMVLTPDGASLKGMRAPGEESREFLASSDNWFRPTQLRTGPDGVLWIADMYRAVIEHPEWIPPETQKKIDLRAGSEEGRIYRVYPVDRRPRPIPRRRASTRASRSSSCFETYATRSPR